MKNKKLRIRILIVVSFLFVIAFQSFALQAQENDIDLLKRKINIDAEDASISSIISTMANLSGCNIVMAMEKQEKEEAEQKAKHLTIHLKDVPIENALSLVVKSAGLSYRLIGEKTFIVGKKEVIEEEVGERSYIIHLNYVDVNKIEEALQILPGQIVPIQGQNALLIRANPNSFAEIEKKIKQIDVPQKQIEIQARLIEVSVKQAEEYGIDWSKLSKLTTILAEDPVNTDGAGLPYDYDDATGAQIFGKKEGNDLGVLPENQYFQKLEGFDNMGHFSRQLYAFDITIDWLLEHNAAKLLTDTRITALNGEEASIHIGEVVPFVVEDEDKQVQVEREDVGIMLKIKPTVNKDNKITTRIEPQVSSVLELVGGYIPRTKVRRAVSTVTVPDGRTIVVGGLLNSSLTDKTHKIPLLGDIPYIGKLFQHTEKHLSKTDLIIEITPHLVDTYGNKLQTDVDQKLDKRLIEEGAKNDN